MKTLKQLKNKIKLFNITKVYYLSFIDVSSTGRVKNVKTLLHEENFLQRDTSARKRFCTKGKIHVIILILTECKD